MGEKKNDVHEIWKKSETNRLFGPILAKNYVTIYLRIRIRDFFKTLHLFKES